MGFNSNKMNTKASCFLACLVALLMSESCFGVPMGQIPMGHPTATRDPLEPSVEYPREPSMVGIDRPKPPSMVQYPDEPSMVVVDRLKPPSMVQYPDEPSIETAQDYPLENQMDPVGPG